ncbi:MAG: epoxide hydrolase [Pseudomonadales bacterium]|jgi:pimeloyl-ACP methyl ester carboxylesterase|nr:epoxide hydrolase [Pseudomonadales bacterium]
MTDAIRPFEIAIDEKELEILEDRLAVTRWPDALVSDWSDGTDRDWLRALCEYWYEEFDWRAQEAGLNRFPQFLAAADEADPDLGEIHFLHVRSAHAAATPLLLVHGWPGSFVEFRHCIDALVDPEAHGGSADDAFHVVVPSLPGYGFSAAPKRHGVNGRRVAERFDRLMAQLGYDRYFAQGGDWGSHVCTWLAHVSDACAGIHLNLVFAPMPREDDPWTDVSDEEKARLAASRERMKDGVAYQEIQGTRPQTLGYGLTDSPAGLAAWIGEKFHAWSQHDGDVFQAISRDDLLTNLSVYWFTRTATSAARFYYEHRNHHADPPVPERIEVPTAVAVFPGELYLPPRAWVERHYAVSHWSVQDRGGHFAALEQPEALVADLRVAFAALR